MGSWDLVSSVEEGGSHYQTYGKISFLPWLIWSSLLWPSTAHGWCLMGSDLLEATWLCGGRFAAVWGRSDSDLLDYWWWPLLTSFMTCGYLIFLWVGGLFLLAWSLGSPWGYLIGCILGVVGGVLTCGPQHFGLDLTSRILSIVDPTYEAHDIRVWRSSYKQRVRTRDLYPLFAEPLTRRCDAAWI